MGNTHDMTAGDEVIGMFRSHHLKITPQRIAVYEELARSQEHPTADSLYQSIKPKHPGISFDTVNRTLLTFADVGIVDIIEGLGNQRRYDANVDSHHHLHCVNCGKIIDFDDESFDSLEIPEEIASRYEVISKRVVIKVLCEDCAEKNTP